MEPPTTGSGCDWPGCSQAAVHELAMQPGMTLRIDGTEFDGAAFAVCEEHAPRIAQLVLDEVDDAVRRQSARRNFAPGDAEWTETFDE